MTRILKVEKYYRDVEWNVMCLCDHFQDDFKDYILGSLDPVVINKEELSQLAEIVARSMQEISDITLGFVDRLRALDKN